MKGLPGTERQRGAVLIVALILLVVMLLISLSGVRNVTFEERMSTNTYDRGLAFQATEAALRAGERTAQTQAAAGNSGFSGNGIYTDADGTCGSSPCQNGLCSQPDKDCSERWKDASFSGWVDATGLGLTSLAVTPQYIVEYLGGAFPCTGDPGTGPQNCKLYRVTARSRDSAVQANRSMVMLQSLFRTQ